MCVNFWSFLITFWSIVSENDEKLDFAIKKHTFSLFFDTNFSQILSLFGVILGSF